METSVGGRIQGVSLDSFLQIVQMDRITCTLKVSSQRGSGILYFVEGELFSATTGNLDNVEAACQIISWEDAVIEINNTCNETENKIKQPLMNILMEGMRLRDEAGKSAPIGKKETEFSSPENIEGQTLPESKKGTGGKSTKGTSGTSSTRATLPVGGKTPDGKQVKSIQETSRTGWKKISAYLGILLLIALIGVGFNTYLAKLRHAESGYRALMAEVDATPLLETKQLLLQTYLREKSGGKYTPNVEQKLNAVQDEIVRLDLTKVDREAGALMQAGNLEQALALYDKLEARSPKTSFSNQIAQKRTDLTNLIDKRVFETLMQAAENKGVERIFLYTDYIKSNPTSPHRQRIEKLISEMSDEFFRFTEKQIIENGKLENWKKCLSLVREYIEIYPSSTHTGVLKEYQSLCEEEIIQADALMNIIKRGEALGDNYDQILKLYSDYQKNYPHSRSKNKIQIEIDKVKALAEKKRIASEIQRMSNLLSTSADRFTVNPNGTVKDNKTGLIWCMIDSTTMVNKCIDYQEALNFVKNLNIGGYTDWRLPAPEELTVLYRQKPSFPSTTPTWYWTSQTHKRYLGRWMIDVDVVSTETSTEEDAKKKESWHCGAVRAVRGGR